MDLGADLLRAPTLLADQPLSITLGSSYCHAGMNNVCCFNSYKLIMT